jgi:SMC interacting uncharacterized protein involved in chromosome segregation
MTKKDAYVKMMKAQLDKWSAEIDQLQAEYEKTEAGLQIEYADEIEKVQSLRTAAIKQFSDLKESGETKWTEFKAGVDAAWNALGNAVKEAQDQIQ